MASKPKATDAAKALAEEEGVDLASVEPTGSDGQVIKPDVEAVVEAAAPEEEAPEKLYYGRINPLAGTDRIVLHDSGGVQHLLVADPGSGIVRDRVFAESDFEELNEGQGAPPSAEHPDGFRYLLEGREV